MAGRPPRTPDGPLNPPLVLASTFHAGGPVAYGRDGNDTWSAFEAALGALEGGPCVAFASGMAAASAVFEQVPVGAPVVVPSNGYYGTRAALAGAPAGRFEVRMVDLSDTPAALDAVAGSALVWIESPANPGLEVADLAVLCRGAHQAGAVVAVDNTFMTPLGQRPLEFGADVVVHSVSKLIAGHSDVVLGAAVARPDGGLAERLHRHRSMTGAIPGPLAAYLALRGLRTLPLRLERGQASAGELAHRLVGHREVASVRYPGLASDRWHELARAQMTGFGTMVAFELAGGASAAEAVAGATDLIVHATSLGGVETQIERRARWPGESAPPSLLRLSVGCEDVEDLWDDLGHALEVASRVGRRSRAAKPVRVVTPHTAGGEADPPR